MQLEGLSFPEAVKELAQSAGVAVEERELTAEERAAFKRRDSLRDALDEACSFFEKTLWTSALGADARRYLDDRGINKETARKERLGFATGERGQTVVEHLHRKGFIGEIVAEAGLARRGQYGDGFYSFFRDRLMFPIRDERGRVVSFGGRKLAGDGPKYINTAETPLYKKKKVLYGLNSARPAIQKADRAIIVEGYFDVIALQQAGFVEVVASCGTALTPEHLTIIRRLTRNLVLVLDSDKAGTDATEKVIPLCLDAQLQPWRVEIEDGNDPDDLIQSGGRQAFEAALSAREPGVEWLIRRKLNQYGRDAAGKERVIREIRPLLNKLPTLAPTAAQILGVPTGVVLREVQTQRLPLSASPEYDEQRWRPDKPIVHLLWLLFHYQGIAAPIVLKFLPELVGRYPQVSLVLTAIVARETPAAVLTKEHPPGVSRVLSAILGRTDLYQPSEVQGGVVEIIAKFALEHLERQDQTIGEKIGHAERNSDEVEITVLIQEKIALNEVKYSLNRAIKKADWDACIDIVERHSIIKTHQP